MKTLRLWVPLNKITFDCSLFSAKMLRSFLPFPSFLVRSWKWFCLLSPILHLLSVSLSCLLSSAKIQITIRHLYHRVHFQLVWKLTYTNRQLNLSQLIFLAFFNCWEPKYFPIFYITWEGFSVILKTFLEALHSAYTYGWPLGIQKHDREVNPEEGISLSQ